MTSSGDEAILQGANDLRDGEPPVVQEWGMAPSFIAMARGKYGKMMRIYDSI